VGSIPSAASGFGNRDSSPASPAAISSVACLDPGRLAVAREGGQFVLVVHVYKQRLFLLINQSDNEYKYLKLLQ
jgi:hypothetical protein